MKLNILETHDRFVEFLKQKDYISKGCSDCTRLRPEEFGDHSFYIFAHCRSHDNGWQKRLIWEPRLTKPKAQTNSMLFKSYPPGDNIKIIWMIPARELWFTYENIKMLQNLIVRDSIHDFQYNRKSLEEKEPDDMTEEEILRIYKQIAYNENIKKLAKI